MSKLQELIRELCPDGVEYKKLRDICKLNRGTRVVRNDLSKDGEFEVYQNSLTPLGYYDKSNYPAYTAFIISAGAAGEIGFTEKPIWAADDCLCLTCPDNISSKYVYYCLLNNKLFLSSRVRKASVPRLARTAVEQFEIPIPPLPVQEEIVRILDHFTNLAAELQAELQARKEQYEYYRNKLLTFDKIGGGTQSVTWMKMSEICNLQRGKVYSKEYLRDNLGSYPVYSSQTMNNGELGRISTYDFDGTYLTWTTDGAYAGTIFKRKGRFSITNVCGIISMKSNLVTIDFLYYWLSLKAKEYVYSGMGNPKLMSNQVEKIPVPIFSISEQQRIVSILDKFEALVNGLTEGLPAEIAAVQEQYEYYRNKLLSFPKLAVA